MSQKVNYDHPFTDEEKEYLEARGKGHLIEVNERRFKDGGPKAEKQESFSLTGGSKLDEYPDEVVADVKTLKVDELRAELDELGVAYPDDAKKADLQLLLAAEWAKEG